MQNIDTVLHREMLELILCHVWCDLKLQPWDISLSTYSASNGHVDVLKWTKKMCIPWNGNICLMYMIQKEWINYATIPEKVPAQLPHEMDNYKHLYG